MNHDINVGKVRLNCFRQSKEPGVFMLQMRVPGGTVDAKYLSYVEHISRTWGDGNFHFGTRQTFDIPGIKYAKYSGSQCLFGTVYQRGGRNSLQHRYGYGAMSRSRGTPRRVIRPSGPEISPPVSEITTVSAAILIRLNWQGRSNRSSSQVITISRSIYPAAPMTAIKLICVISASLELQG